MMGSFAVTIFAALLPSIATAAAKATSDPSVQRPNFVFLVCESTDGRTWREGYQDDVIPLPNLRQLEQLEGGYSFHRNYANSPVCCPSRATLWSGRHAHNIPHVQRQRYYNSTTDSDRHKFKELPVGGAWNNYEGLPRDFDLRMDQILERHAGYETYISGKRDWTTGGHTENVRLNAWTASTRFPYSIPETGGWQTELGECASSGTVIRGNTSAHGGDWKNVNQTLEWIYQYSRNETNREKPFFVYQGMNIVHPPYRTNEYYHNRIDPKKIRVPRWPPLESLHPCDLQSSMLKGCIPPLRNATAVEWYHSRERRRNIRRIYYAMIAEFDAMVGAYMRAIRDIGAWDNTIFVVTSDHGDLQMEHQQIYKMVPYDASSSVPLVIHDGRKSGRGVSSRRVVDDPGRSNPRRRVIEVPTQLIDIYPTIMELAGVNPADYPKDALDGRSLVTLMTAADGRLLGNDGQSAVASTRPDFVVSQFHGMNLAMSWFLVVRPLPCGRRSVDWAEKRSLSNGDTNAASLAKNASNNICTMKLVIWGTGREVDSQLFDLTNDPGEMNNLIHNSSHAFMIPLLEQALRSVVDYPRIALEIAQYNKESMSNWIEVMGEPHWRDAIHASNLRWSASWNQNSDGAFQALEEWLNGTAKVIPCRSDLVWPPTAPGLAAHKGTS